MEWDFTPTQVMQRKVKYSLEDFLKDFKVELAANFTMTDEAHFDRILKIAYGVLYFTTIGKTAQDICETLRVPHDIVEVILKNNQANLDMLEHILMGMFVENLEESGGILGDEDNLALLNARLRQFHSKHHL